MFVMGNINLIFTLYWCLTHSATKELVPEGLEATFSAQVKFPTRIDPTMTVDAKVVSVCAKPEFQGETVALPVKIKHTVDSMFDQFLREIYKLTETKPETSNFKVEALAEGKTLKEVDGELEFKLEECTQ